MLLAKVSSCMHQRTPVKKNNWTFNSRCKIWLETMPNSNALFKQCAKTLGINENYVGDDEIGYEFANKDGFRMAAT